LTYNRLEYAEKTLRSTLDNIKFSGELSVHIADDGSSQEYRQSLYDLAGGYDKVKGVSVSNSEQGGYGKNYNLAMQQVHLWADYVLPLEDDWVLSRELDADLYVAALQDPRIGCVRLGYVGFTQALVGEIIIAHNNYYFLFSPDTPEPHVFAGHPRIESKEWERSVGPWPEGLRPGATEFAVTHMRPAREKVVWPMDVNPFGSLFYHIGAVKS
jgi:glycosyltransferase involved in cell wall biosynthesis